MREYLQECIEKAAEFQKRITIMFDSIDQLSSDDGAYSMKWLPKEFPSFVKIILSTLPDEKYLVFNNLKVSRETGTA